MASNITQQQAEQQDVPRSLKYQSLFFLFYHVASLRDYILLELDRAFSNS